jgi:biopolymer transport protein ExbD
MAKKIPQINASSMADISFLLLIFFLVTTSMDVNKGLVRRLPPPAPEKQEKTNVDINKRNLLVVRINSKNDVYYRDGSMEMGDLEKINSLDELRALVKEFIVNPKNKSHYPKLVTEVITSSNEKENKAFEEFGEVEYTKDHIISVQNDVDTQYQAYLDVQNELVAAYNQVREEFSLSKFGRHFKDLTDMEQKFVQKVYPQKISEAEPKNYN